MPRFPVFRAQSGVSLIESLVALFVLALGILGLAGLQTRTLTETRLTNARAAAVRMTTDIHERMMLNNGAMVDSINNATPFPYVVGWGGVPAGTNCNTTACTHAQLAGFDLSQWKNTLSTVLPGGDGLIYQSTDDPREFGVLIAWTDNIDDKAIGDLADYTNPFTVSVTTNVGAAACPANMICHLTRVRP